MKDLAIKVHDRDQAEYIFKLCERAGKKWNSILSKQHQLECYPDGTWVLIDRGGYSQNLHTNEYPELDFDQMKEIQELFKKEPPKPKVPFEYVGDNDKSKYDWIQKFK